MSGVGASAERAAALVLEGLAGAVVAVDLDDRVTVWNEAAERLFGWPATEVVGHALPIVPPEAEDERRQWMARAVAGEEIEVTTQRRSRDRGTLDVTLRVSPVRESSGEVVGVAVLCRDAAPRLRTVSRLERSQAELALVRRLITVVQRLVADLDLAAVLHAVVEVATELLACDGGVLSLTDDPGRYVTAASVEVPFVLDGHEIVAGEGLHGHVVAHGEPVIIDDYSTWAGSAESFRSGGFRAAVAVPVVDEDRGVIGVLSAHTTDPDRRFGPEEAEVLVVVGEYAALAIANANAYRRVASERARFLALVQAMPAGVAVVEDGVVRAWNEAAAELTGRAAEEVLGGPPPLDLDAASAGPGLEVKVGDRHRYLEAIGSDLPGGTGRLYLIQDSTEQRDLDRAKDLFFATTSHELKTPLTVVRGLAGTLLRHWDRMPDDRRIDALETIERRADNLDRLIERILVGSRVQAGALDIVTTPIDLGRLVTEMVEGFAAAAGPHHRVVADVAPGLPLVTGDRQVIDTILGHLLENAIKYSPGGGEVRVRAEPEPSGERVRIVVRDHGVGIDGDIGRLLHPFVQADSATTRRFGGVGLGLYIVVQLVDALGGELSAGNAEDGGAEFTVAIPAWR